MGALIETPDVTWSFANLKWYDFCYEHCSLFSPASIKYALMTNDLSVTEIKEVFGGQYMQIYASKLKNTKTNLDAEVDKMLFVIENYRKKEKDIIEENRKAVENASLKGGTIFWGAGAKSNIALNELDKDLKFVEAVVDINPCKQGKFIAGTGHKIISPIALIKSNIKNVFIMNENYTKEILAILKTIGIQNLNIKYFQKSNALEQL